MLSVSSLQRPGKAGAVFGGRRRRPGASLGTWKGRARGGRQAATPLGEEGACDAGAPPVGVATGHGFVTFPGLGRIGRATPFSDNIVSFRNNYVVYHTKLSVFVSWPRLSFPAAATPPLGVIKSCCSGFDVCHLSVTTWYYSLLRKWSHPFRSRRARRYALPRSVPPSPWSWSGPLASPMQIIPVIP